MVNKDNFELVNYVMANDYILAKQAYQYFFFKINAKDYEQLESITITVNVYSGSAQIIMNEYIGSDAPRLLSDGVHSLTFTPETLEKGENMLAYKGEVKITSVVVNQNSSLQAQQPIAHIDEQNPYANALEYLLASKIKEPTNSPFAGSCYCIYDYTNSCYRMPSWLWSDAPIVSALLDTIKSGQYQEHHEEMAMLAKSICEVLLNTQIIDDSEESYGAYISRYRYYFKTDYSFNRLLGPNDTSFVVKWAMLPMYEYTGDERYLTSAKLALNWVENIIRTMPFVPSHYYFENKVWEDRAFVDTGFVVEGFQKYDEVTDEGKYPELMEFVMNRFIKQFRLENGFYGQNYLPDKGVDHNLFARGQGWVLEGLLACVRGNVNKQEFLAEAKSIANLMIENQNKNGSWSWSLGDFNPNDDIKAGTGICEKGTAVLAMLLAQLYLLDDKQDERYLTAAQNAVAWCEANMALDVTEGFGGIASASINSAITGLPFLKVATGYANAFYLLAKNAINKED